MMKSDTLTRRVKPAVKWPGGKSRLLKHLLPLVPDHKLYVEVFGGGLALLLALPKRRGQVANDVSGELINCYRCLQRHLPEVERLWHSMVVSRELFHDCRNHPGQTDVERAVRFLYRMQYSFGGNGQNYGVSAEPSRGGPFVVPSSKLPIWRAWHQRMDGVVIENIPWERLLPLYDRPHTFWFFDPPYVCPNIKAYASFTQGDMERLAAAIRKLKGRWLLTVNDSPANRLLWKDYPITCHWRQSGATKAASKKQHGELIITDGRPVS